MTECAYIQPKVFSERLFANKLFLRACKFTETNEDRCERFRLLLRCHRNRKKSSNIPQLEWKKSTINCEIFNALIKFAIYRGKMIFGKQGVFWVYLVFETREMSLVFDEGHPCFKWHRRKWFQCERDAYQLVSETEDKEASSSVRSMCLVSSI